ncbi:MAG: hypothetical protein BRC37_04425 [Cyanobacteria bacterium QH_3_48_40]|nr:MAG: hypothetical protein BRC37_04425 [Cyanobacteria bacterium QH_3_48_40]
MPLVSLIDTPQPKGVGILASTGESRKHGTKSRYFPRSQKHIGFGDRFLHLCQFILNPHLNFSGFKALFPQ